MENFKEEFNLDESMFEGEALNGAETLEYDDDDDGDEMYLEYDDDDDDEGLSAEFDDDDDDESSEYDDDDDDEGSSEFILPFAINGIRKLLSKKASRRSRSYGKGRRPSVYRGKVARIASRSNLRGMLRTPRGKSLPIRLPKNVATKKDVFALRRSISSNRRLANRNTRSVGKVISDLKKAKAHIMGVDKKHSIASKAQNTLIGKMSKKLVSVNKDVDKTKEQMQMNQLLSMFMTPQLEEFTIESVTDGPVAGDLGGSTIKVQKSKNTDNNLGLMMAMSGGLGGDSGSMNPMMYYFMFNQ